MQKPLLSHRSYKNRYWAGFGFSVSILLIVPI